MRVSLSIVIVIAMLIVGILVVKNLKTETVDGVKITKATEHARDIAKEAEKTIETINQRIQDAQRQPASQTE